MTVARVRLWGRTIGAVSWNDDRDSAYCEYDRAFIPGGRQVAPLTMPLGNEIYSFPALPRQTFHGLPGLLADSLPDRFGNALIYSYNPAILRDVQEAVSRWRQFAEEAGVPGETTRKIAAAHRTDLLA